MINVSSAAASKITELLAEEQKQNSGLRVFVQGGGCSGFQYGFTFDEEASDDDTRMERGGVTRRYRAHPVPGPHPRVDQLLREKYGWADRWVRLLAPDGEHTLAVRLDPT